MPTRREVALVCDSWIVTPATRAAIEVGRQFGVHADEPTVLQETNNTVVWLRPQPVIAKVATRDDAKGDGQLEHAVAVELVACGAEIAAPLPDAKPTVHRDTGFVVTLWRRLDVIDRLDIPLDEVGSSLRRLHAALTETRQELPSFRTGLARARTALDNDTFMASLTPADRNLLRGVYDDGLIMLDEVAIEERRLHGEPHEYNRLVTADGLRWIDFESCCVGPLEWDLAFQPEDLDENFPEADTKLLTLLRRLNSARVATWCLGQTRFPEMRRHGEVHLARLRTAPGDR
jgi:Ser/Thr protein kinase RdoA (MazF antagonist)